MEQGVSYSNSIFERSQIFRLPVEQLNIGLDPGDAAARTGQMRLISGFTFSRKKVSLMVPTQEQPFLQNNYVVIIINGNSFQAEYYFEFDVTSARKF